MGNSPAVGPVPNEGLQAAALQKVGVLLKISQAALQEAGAASDVGKTLLEVMTKLAKLVPTGSVTPAGTRNVLDQAQRQNIQNNSQIQMLRQQAMNGGGQAAAAMGAGAPRPPMTPQAGAGL